MHLKSGINFEVSCYCKQLTKLNQVMELNTGSIDMIKCKSGKYYFLEINPCGIYEGISNACNYNLNKKIAEWLIN